MLRLKPPAYDLAVTIEACIEGITGNNKFKASVERHKNAIVAYESAYRSVAESSGLATIPALEDNDAEDEDEDASLIILGDLTKSDFGKLYERYLRDRKKSGRKIYDHIMNSAEGKCPYCCGLGSTRNLDHHLPFAYFPQFSILPLNLVPACRDCNMDGRPAGYFTDQAKQIIQPYLDDRRFFDEQWISGAFIPAAGSQPNRIEYFADPPANWTAMDRSRAKNHFSEFGLATKCAMRAAEVLNGTLLQVAALRNAGCDDRTVAQRIFDPGERGAPFVNHWLTGMHQALRQSVSIL